MEPSAVTVAEPHQGLSLPAITDRIMSGELTKEKLDMVKDLVAMDAERKFAAAFVALQAEIPKVQATKAVPNNDGSTRYKFAPFEDIMRQVGPMLLKHGFSVSFSSRFEDTRIIQVCTLQHEAGHKRVNEFAVRIGKGPPSSSESQADGAASTYAKRFALTDALNIVVAHQDNDARVEGAYITKEQAEELEHRVKMVNGNVKRFLDLADAPSFDKIRASRYGVCNDFLTQKEKRPA